MSTSGRALRIRFAHIAARGLTAGCCALALLGGCRRDEQAPLPEQPGSRASPAGAQRPESGESPLLPEARSWSRAEAAAKLAEERSRLSAAVRLVRLADVRPLCVPDPLPPRLARRLHVLRLSDRLWALGWRRGDSRLQAPVLIDAAGNVTLPATGAEEEVAVLYRAADPEQFPHLIIVPRRVLIVGEDLRPALVARSPGLSFEPREAEGRAYVALLWRGPPASRPSAEKPHRPAEVARYHWDPRELAFLGPLADRLPDPPGGVFELDLEQSAALVPVGGVVPDAP